MKLTESEVKELVKAALREAFINEGFMIKEKRFPPRNLKNCQYVHKVFRDEKRIDPQIESYIL